jgi:hypothetical protein
MFWACAVAEPRLSPEQRLTGAIALSRAARFGAEVPTKIHVHPSTAAEIAAPEGVELVPEPRISRFAFLFPLEASDDAGIVKGER